ncbi:barstar family protein [Pasteurella testudinis]|uniref:barstar family protein n=1 Tax=Pasteurella testudinis TaxID=761 RepID=UPI004057D14E
MKELINYFYMDGNDIKEKQDFYIKLDEFLRFNSYVEGSAQVPVLDVLWDVMTCGAGLNCVLYWQHSESSKKNIGFEYFNKIINLLKEVENYQTMQCELYEQYKNDSPFKFYLE